MAQRFFQGRTNNHLTWAMVDATDFATPESALSAATKIKIYGKLQGGTGTNFVTSGTGSLTNDITHVGASVLGLYTIALAKADLSDASAAWYDQYIVSLSATGAAYQALVVEGVLAAANVSSLSGIISDIYSCVSDLRSDFQSRVPKAVATNSQLSDLHSDLVSLLTTSTAGVWVNKSVMSDLRSAITAGPTVTLTVQNLSDIGSAVWVNAIGTRVDSRLLKTLSDTSQILSLATTTGFSLTSDVMSNIRSAIAAGPAATITVSDISAIAAAVWDEDYTIAGNNASSSFGSAFRIATSKLSNVDAVLSDFKSDFGSRVPKEVASKSLLSDVNSDLASKVAGIGAATVSASDISAIAAAVWDEDYTIAGNNASSSFGSAFRIATSKLSNVDAVLSDFKSDFQSRVPKAVATNSQLSALQSDIMSQIVYLSAVGSQIDSVLSDFNSNFQSRVPGLTATTSDFLSQMSQMFTSYFSQIQSNTVRTQSIVLGNSGAISDLDSGLVSQFSNLLSLLTTSTAGVWVNKSVMSDIRSAILTGPAGVLTTSDMSDVASAVWAQKYKGAAAHNVASSFGSAFHLMTSRLSSLSDAVSDLGSDLRSLITTTGVALNAATLSDVKSAIAAGPAATITVSDISNIASAVWGQKYTAHNAASTFGSVAQKNTSSISAVYALLSDFESNLTSRVPKAVATNSQLSDLHSDLKSYLLGMSSLDSNTYSLVLATTSDLLSKVGGITAATITASDLSDIGTVVYNRLVSDISDIKLASQRAASRALIIQSDTSTIIVRLSDAHSDLASKVDGIGAVGLSVSNISDIASAVWGAKYKGASAHNVASSFGSAFMLNRSDISNIYSLLSDLQSDFVSKVTKEVASKSLLSDVNSDLASKINAVGLTPSTLSDIGTVVYNRLVTDLSDIKSAAVQANSRALQIFSDTSNIYSLLSDFQSDMVSRVTGGIATRSQVSDLASDLRSYLVGISAILSDVQSVVGAITFKKNTAVTGFMFKMFDSGDHVTPKTGLTITATRSIDGGAFGACANSATEVSAGWYKINLATTDMNGDLIVLKFTAAAADATEVEIKTQP